MFMRKNVNFYISLVLLLTLLGMQPSQPAHAQAQTVNVAAPSTAETDQDVRIVVGVQEGSKPIPGVSVDVLVGGTSIGSCLTDALGSCSVGYAFDKPGSYVITAIFEDKTDIAYIRVVEKTTSTPTVTSTSGPTTTGTNLSPFQANPTLLLPTLNIPSSTPTVPYHTSTPRPSTNTPTPLPSKTPNKNIIVPTYDPGYTPTPFVAADPTMPVSQGLSFLAIVLAGSALVLLIPRIQRYRRLRESIKRKH